MSGPIKDQFSVLCSVSIAFAKRFDEIKTRIHHSQDGFIKRWSSQPKLMKSIPTVSVVIVDGGLVRSAGRQISLMCRLLWFSGFCLISITGLK